MSMFYQEKAIRQKVSRKQSVAAMSEEGLIQLGDDQLESIAGGKGSPAAARLRADEGILAALQLENSRTISVHNTTNIDPTVIVSSTTVGVGNQGTNIKK